MRCSRQPDGTGGVAAGGAARLRAMAGSPRVDAAVRGIGRLTETRAAKALALTRDVASGGVAGTLAGHLGERAGVGAAALLGKGVAAGRRRPGMRADWAAALRDPVIRAAARRGAILAPSAAKLGPSVLAIKAAADAADSTMGAALPGRGYAAGTASQRADANAALATKLGAARSAAGGPPDQGDHGRAGARNQSSGKGSSTEASHGWVHPSSSNRRESTMPVNPQINSPSTVKAGDE